jgi:hypothetical protein
MGLIIFQRFHMIVDLHGNHAGFIGNISAHHQHHAELPYRMGKTQNRRG